MVPDLQLRPGGPGDVPRVVEVLLAASTGPGHPPQTRSPERLAEDLVAPAERGELWVAEIEEHGAALVVGFVSVAPGWVPLLFVHPDHQRRGVGRALLDLAAGLEPEGFELRVHAANTAARNFYRAAGLVELEHTDGSRHDDGAPDVRLAWPGADPLGYLRTAIDRVDTELAHLLARRFALASAVQDHKAATSGVGGERARDAAREAEIVRRMAALAPGVEVARLRRVMAVVLGEGLAAWEATAR